MLNAEWFATTRHAQVVIDTWPRQYNHIRPHHAGGLRLASNGTGNAIGETANQWPRCRRLDTSETRATVSAEACLAGDKCGQVHLEQYRELANIVAIITDGENKASAVDQRSVVARGAKPFLPNDPMANLTPAM